MTAPPAGEDAPRRRPWGALALIALVVALAVAAVWPIVEEVLVRLLGPPGVELREAFGEGDSGVTFDHAAFDRILGEVVDGDGWVDYGKLFDDPRPLDAYLTALATADFDALGRDEKLAFLINAYNACTLRLVVDHWPLESVRAIPEEERWTQVRWVVGGRKTSLDQLEHGWLRAKFREPRIHFAINKGCAGSAPLRREAYSGDRIEQQLADQMARTNGSERWFAFLPEAGLLRLTQIYLWYAGDFQQVAGSLIDFVRRWAPELDAWCEENGTPRVLWLEFDWRHNGIEHRPG